MGEKERVVPREWLWFLWLLPVLTALVSDAGIMLLMQSDASTEPDRRMAFFVSKLECLAAG